MAKKPYTGKMLVVVANPGEFKSTAEMRRTVAAADDKPGYVMHLKRGKPYLLGEREIAAFHKEISAGALDTLEITAEQARVLGEQLVTDDVAEQLRGLRATIGRLRGALVGCGLPTSEIDELLTESMPKALSA